MKKIIASLAAFLVIISAAAALAATAPVKKPATKPVVVKKTTPVKKPAVAVKKTAPAKVAPAKPAAAKAPVDKNAVAMSNRQFGVIGSLKDASFVLLVVEKSGRASYTVNLDSATVYTLNKQSATKSALLAGQHVAVFGAINKQAKTIAASKVDIFAASKK